MTLTVFAIGLAGILAMRLRRRTANARRITERGGLQRRGRYGDGA